MLLSALMMALGACGDGASPAPTISVQPGDTPAVAGSAATLSVTASGTDIAYQWQSSSDGGASWRDIAAATQASYTTPATRLADNGTRFRVIVSAAGISVTSAAVVLTVVGAPTAAAITVQPLDQSVTAGSAAAFTAAATGTPTPTLQWQRSTDGGATWSSIADATAPTHSTGPVSLGQNGERYRVVASNGTGSVSSNAALLSVTAAAQAPVVGTQPANQSVTQPAAATFTATASGVPTPTWQWQLSTDDGGTWANINGAVSVSYTTPATSVADSGRRYRAVASNSAGSATSSAAILTVAGAVGGRAWQTAGLIDASNLQNQRPEIAFDASGNALVVWQQRDSTTGFSIWANRFTAATNTWSVPARVEPGTSGTAEFPQVAVDASGNAIAIWYQSGTGGADIWTNRYTAATNSWGTAALIENNAIYAQIAVDSVGNGLLVWNRNSGAIGSVWAKRYTAGTGWSTAARIEAGSTNSAGRPQIAVDANGNALAVWNRFNGGSRNDIWANRYTATTNTWGTAVLIETGNAGTAENPKIAVDANGNGVALWNYFDGARYDVMAAHYVAATGTWGPAAISLTASAGSAGDMRVAFDASGNAIAVWDQGKANGMGSDIWANRFTPSAGWGTAALIETNDAGSAGFARIVIDGSGNALVVWQHQEGFTRYDIWANRYTAGVGWGTAALIETDNWGSALRPQIAVDGSGNAIAVWEQSDVNHLGIWANSFR